MKSRGEKEKLLPNLDSGLCRSETLTMENSKNRNKDSNRTNVTDFHISTFFIKFRNKSRAIYTRQRDRESFHRVKERDGLDFLYDSDREWSN